MADDAIPPRVIDSRSGSIRLAPNVKAKSPPKEPEEDAEEDVPAARSGVITMASEVARDVRDAVTTASRSAVKNDDESPPPRSRSWLTNALYTLLFGGAGLGGMEARLHWDNPVAEETAHSAGRVQELSTQVQTLQSDASKARASDLQRDYDQAKAFRSLDGNIGLLLDAVQVPIGARVKLDAAIEQRQTDAIDAYEDAQREAQRRAFEASVADRDSVGAP
jgi:hypothetical protein